MNKNIAKCLLVLYLPIVLTGCKLALTVPSGGDVTSASGTANCAQGSVCELTITDTTFNESFTAVPKTGYVFTKWKAGDGYVCANSTTPTCVTSNTQFEGNAQVEAIIASDATFKIEPIFEVTLNSLAAGLQETLAYLEQIKGLVPVVVDSNDKVIGVPVPYLHFPTMFGRDTDQPVYVKFENVAGTHHLLLNPVANSALMTQGLMAYTNDGCTGVAYVSCSGESGERISTVCPVGLLGNLLFAADVAAEPIIDAFPLSLSNDSGTCLPYDQYYQNRIKVLFPAVQVELNVTFPIRVELR